jgi:hypothetical protein
MDSLKNQVLELLKEEKSSSFLVSSEEYDYFSPQKKAAPVEKKAPVIDEMPDIRQLIAKTLPDVALTTTVPDDASAKKMSDLWRQKHLSAKVFVVSFGETGPFLQNVTKAIDTLLAPAHLIEGPKMEREKSWELALSAPALQLILVPPFAAWKTTQLARFYRENPSSNTHFLKDTPLMFMQPVVAYLKNPDLKRELWKSLCSHLSTST